MKRILTLTLLWLAFLSCRLSAQTLNECHNMAREHYPEIKQYDLIGLAEQYSVSNAMKAWLPQIVLSGQATYQSATPTYPEVLNNFIAAQGVNMSGISKDQYKVALDITQNIWDGGHAAAQRAVVEADAAEQRSQLDVSMYELQSRVNNLYFGILLLDERVAQTRTLIDVLDSNLSRMQAYHNNGVATQADVDAIEAELLTVQQTLSQVLSTRDSYRRMLELFIGTPLSDTRLTRPAMQEVTTYTTARPELAMFAARSEKLASQRRMINSSVMPRFTAFAQGFYGNPGLDMFKSMVSDRWTLNGIVGVRMTWNIGSFYTRSNELEKISIAERQVDVQREVFLFNTQLQTTGEVDEIARLRKAVEDDDRIVELRTRVREAAESKLENGVINTTDLLQKIADETTAMLLRSTHEIELLQATYRLKNILNQ